HPRRHARTAGQKAPRAGTHRGVAGAGGGAQGVSGATAKTPQTQSGRKADKQATHGLTARSGPCLAVTAITPTAKNAQDSGMNEPIPDLSGRSQRLLMAIPALAVFVAGSAYW